MFNASDISQASSVPNNFLLLRLSFLHNQLCFFLLLLRLATGPILFATLANKSSCLFTRLPLLDGAKLWVSRFSGPITSGKFWQQLLWPPSPPSSSPPRLLSILEALSSFLSSFFQDSSIHLHLKLIFQFHKPLDCRNLLWWEMVLDGLHQP